MLLRVMRDGRDLAAAEIEFERVAIGLLDEEDAFAVVSEVGPLSPIVDFADIGWQFIHWMRPVAVVSGYAQIERHVVFDPSILNVRSFLTMV